MRKQIKTESLCTRFLVLGPQLSSVRKNPRKLRKINIPLALLGERLKYKEQSPSAFS